MLELYTNIKKYRLQRQMTQSRLAELVGYSDKGMVSRVENGKVDLPQSQIVKFATALNVSPAQLMGWVDDKLVVSEDDLSLNKPWPELSKEVEKLYYTDRALKIAQAFDGADEQTREMIEKMLEYSELMRKGDGS